MRRGAVWIWGMAAGALCLGQGFPHRASAQEQEPVAAVVADTPANLAAVLARPVSLNVRDVALPSALDILSDSAHIPILYRSTAGERMARRITLRLTRVPLSVALDTLLKGTSLRIVPLPGPQIGIVANRVSATVAMTGTVIGRVTDAKTGKPVANASVTIDSMRPVKTRENGSFLVPGVPAGAHKLVVRLLGYHVYSAPVTVRDDATETVAVALSVSATTLTDVVTTATGQKLRMEVGNDVGTIKADSVVATQQIRNVSDLLQGRLPGVVVSNTDGAVGSPSKIRLRGANSASLNNDPIVIVDGIRINAQTTTARLQTNVGSPRMLSQVTGPASNNGQPQQAQLAPSRLDDIDPNTIDKVEVLYGPSASSLYGTDAANGVIVITTKRGHPGSLHATFTGDAGQSYMPGTSPEMWWGWGHYGSFLGSGYTASCNLAIGTFAVAANGSCVQDSVTQYNPQNDPNMQTLGMGTSNSVHTTVSGGTDQVQQFLSASLQNNVGMAKMSAVQARLITRLYNESVPPWMRRPNTQQEVDGSSRTTVTLGSHVDVSLSANGIYNNVLNGGNGLQPFINSNQITSGARPTDTLSYLPSESQRTRITSLAKRGLLAMDGTYRPLGWLRMSGQVGGDYTLRTDQAMLRQQDCSTVLQTYALGYVAGCPSQRSEANTQIFVTTVNGSVGATYAPFSWLALTTTGGEQYTHTATSSLQVSNSDPYNCPLAYGTQLLSPSPVCTNSNAERYRVNDAADASASAGVYIEETVNLLGFYYTFGIRRDVASGFGGQTIKQPPQYPKFNLSVPLSDKDFFPKQSIVSLMRVRVAYGQSGNQASQTAVLNNYLGSTFVNSTSSQRAISLQQLGNAALRPEKSAEWEGGFDVSFLENERINTRLTMSRKFTHDLINSFTLPDSYGFNGIGGNSQQYENIGDVVSHSTELSLDARLLDRRALTWNVMVGITRSSNTLVHKAVTGSTYGGNGTQFREGYPLFSYWGSPVVSYADVNHDGILEQNEMTLGPLSFFGAPYPTSTINYNSDVALWNGALRLSATVMQVNGQVTPLCIDVSCGVYPRAAVDRAAPLAQQAAYIQAVYNGGRYLSNSSSVRLNEASMTYTLPAPFAQRLLHAQSVSFTLSGRNLALWTTYAGQDPNVDTSGLLGETSSDNGLGTPQPRSWIVRCNLGF